MKKRKVAKILGRRWNMGEGAEGAIDIHLHASGSPNRPWAAMSGGHTAIGFTPHGAIGCLLEQIAKDDRAESRQ